MAAILTWVLLVLGPTVALTQATLLEGLRAALGRLSPSLGEISRCAMCTGFWVGCVWGLTNPSLGPAASLPWPSLWARALLGSGIDGLCSAAVCWTIVLLVTR